MHGFDCSLSEKECSGSPSDYNERVSPPPSDFLMEDAVVSSALDKYSAMKRSRTDLTDTQLIEIEEAKGT